MKILFISTMLCFEALFILSKWNPLFHFIFLTCLLFSTLKPYLLNLLMSPPVYLVDFSCFKPPRNCKVPFSHFVEIVSNIESFDAQSVEFMAKILTNSGLGQDTYLPPALHSSPPRTHHRETIKEAEMVLFPVVDDLLHKTKLSPQDIDILIVNCSASCPSPSLSSIIINKYSMRSDIKSYNLSGMGCSAGVIGIDLAQNLLKTYRNSNAIVLSTELLSTNWYSGNEKPKLLLNCVFRTGSAAILLTNKTEAKNTSKYKILHTLRTQTCFDDKSYLAAFREEDSRGKLGVTSKKDLLRAVGEALRSHITTLGSRILPFAVKLRHVVSIIRKKMIDKSGVIYMPSFKTVVQHFCLPTSSRALINEVAKGLKLTGKDVEPALMTLHRFGNQSSSSWWYELGYMEGKERVKKGDKVWVLGVGTGLKCSSLIFECLRTINGESKSNPWSDCIDNYPVEYIDQRC